MLQKIFVLVLMSVFFVACGHKKDAQSFEKALQAKTGQKYSIAKLDTDKGEYVGYKNEVTGEDEAYNINFFAAKENFLPVRE